MKDNGLIWWEKQDNDEIKLKKKFLDGKYWVYVSREQCNELIKILKDHNIKTESLLISLSDLDFISVFIGVDYYNKKAIYTEVNTDLKFKEFEDIIKPIKNKTIKSEFFTEKIAVNCKTKKQAKKFLKKLAEIGMEWYGCESVSDTKYKTYKKNTCYDVSYSGNLGYCSLKWYKEQGYRIVDYNDILD